VIGESEAKGDKVAVWFRSHYWRKRFFEAAYLFYRKLNGRKSS